MVSRAWLDKTKVNNTPVKIGAKNHNKEEKMQKQKARKEELNLKEMRCIAGGFQFSRQFQEWEKKNKEMLDKA